MLALGNALSWTLLAAPSLAVGTGTNVTVTLTPTSIVADGNSVSTATATVTDAGGLPAAGETVVFSSSDPGETIGPVIDHGDGTYTATVTSSATVGNATITATDSTGVAQPSGQATLTQTAGPAKTVTVTLSPDSIPANGSSTSTATATVVDAQGRPLSGQAVAVTPSDSGETIGPVTDHGDGSYTATVTSSTTVGTATITATDSSASGQAALTQTAGPAKTVTMTLSRDSIPANGSSTSTATATVVDAQGHPLSRQTVGFSSSDPGEHVSSTTNNHDGSYTATITSSTTVGTATITAADGSLSADSTLSQTAGPAKTVTMTLSPDSILANGSSTSTATATVVDAQGHPLTGQTVGFSSSDTGETISSTTNNHDGSYTATITSSTTVGFATITATDNSVSPRASAQARLAQAANASTTSLVVLPGAPVTNQVVTLIATVTSSSSAATPSGAITFEARGAALSGCAFVPVATSFQSATVTCQTSFSAATSPAQLAAVFTSNRGSIVADSTSATDDLAVGRDATSTALDVSNPTVKVGSRATYTVTVTPIHRGAVAPSGLVEFLDQGAPIASCARQALINSNASAAATCTVTYKKVGEHLITAHYGGDTNFNGSSSSPSQRVRARTLPVQARGTITSTMFWTFYYTPAYTKVLTLMVQNASAGMTARVECRGRGCPFAKRATAVTKLKRCSTRAPRRCSSRAPATIDLVHSFRSHRLHAGSQITIELTRPGFIGKSYLFKIRAGHPPMIEIRCLAPGRTRPGVGC